MPIYTYRCNECGKEFDIKQGINDKPLTECPEEICVEHNHGKAAVSRVISKNIGLVFKGTGFYLTDYKKQNSSTASASHSNVSHSNASHLSTEATAKAKSEPKKADSLSQKKESSKQTA
jgi:putative FmdB family regulatory protein